MRNSLLFLLLASLVFFSCTESDPQTVYAPDGKSVLVGTGTTENESAALTASDFADPEEESYTPKVPFSSDDQLLSVKTINLDLDPSEEQVLVVKKRNGTGEFIRILVADYDEAWDTYRTSWESETSATNIRTFNIQFEDLVGDHNLEIVCRGMTADGRQTLNVYRKAKAPDGIRLSYAEISSIITNGSIEIVELTRNRAYSEQQKNGVSFPIVTLISDPESENILDQVRSTYNWKYQTNRYEVELIEEIPGIEIEETQLRQLFRRDESAFVEFLKGPWYRVDDTSGFDSILHFEPEYGRISFLTGDIQEVYIWDNSHKLLTDRLLISAVNELVVYMRKDVSVQVLALDRIFVRESDTWKGTYARLTDDLQRSLTTANRSKTDLPEPVPALTGRYIGDSGSEMYFDYPSFTLVNDGVTRRGGYSVYQAGANVLELKFLETTGLISDKKTYRIEYSEDAGAGRIIRTVYLTPGIVTVYGFKPTDEAIIRYEQIESVEEEEIPDTTQS